VAHKSKPLPNYQKIVLIRNKICRRDYFFVILAINQAI